MKVKIKKLILAMCLILILISTLPIQTLATFITDINSNAVFGVISGTFVKLGHEIHYADYDNSKYMVFCVQRGVKSPTGIEYTYGRDFVPQYKEHRIEYEYIAEMIYFGYTMNYGMGIPENDDAYRAACCTQQFVWEYIHNNIDSSYPVVGRDSWKPSFMSSNLYENWLAQTESYYNQYHSNVSFNGEMEHVTIGSTRTLTDTNGVLQHYKTFNFDKDGVTFSHEYGSNQLNINVSNNVTVDNVKFNANNYGLYELLPNGTEYNSATMSNYVYINFYSGSVQNVMFSNYVDPSWFNITVEIDYGNALIVKTNENGNTLAGCTFELYKDSDCTQKVRTGISDENGNIYFQKLAPSTYYVKEIAVPTGYLLDTSIQKVEIRTNETAEVHFKNYEPLGELQLFKTDRETGRENRIDKAIHHGDATLEGTEYTLYAKEDVFNVAKTVKYFSKDEEIATFTFDSNGVAKINISTSCKTANLTTDMDLLKGLPMGSYYAKETKVPEGYITDNTIHNIALNYKDMHTRVIKEEDTFTNQVEKAKFEVIKVSSITNETAEIVAGAEFTAILTKYVNFYGSFDEALKHLNEFSKDEYSVFKTENTGHGISGLLAYGEYTVHETYCPSDLVNPVKPFKVVIDKNSSGVIKEYIENDTPFTSYIKIIKKNKKTGKKVTFSNATFSLYKLNENSNEWERVNCKLGRESFDKWTTDNDGIAYTETKLEVGKYKLNELVVPNRILTARR